MSPRLRELPPAYRPAERARAWGAERLTAPELLAAVLQAPNGLELAYELLARFGLDGLARATVEELCRVPGMGPTRAAAVKAALTLGVRLAEEQVATRPEIRSPEDAANLVMAEMGRLVQEELRVILLDTRNRVMRVVTLYRGNVNTTVMRVGEVFRSAVQDNAPGIILVHNHPSGDPTPSPEDVRITSKVVEAGRMLNIQVVDHIIVGSQGFVSLRERGLGFG